VTFIKIIQGDCLKVLPTLDDDSVDFVGTDPPYGINFMGKEWDKALPPKEAFKEMFRVLKPGALAFVMSSPRQDVLWRMLAMLEECGFELGQSGIFWVYASGFPKAYDVSKGIDEKFGLERRTIGIKDDPRYRYSYEHSTKGEEQGHKYGKYRETEGSKVGAITEPACEESGKWDGWKSITGLKPALECILMVNKPFSEKTIVDNVLKWGTGAINVDACRIPTEDDLKKDWESKRKDQDNNLFDLGLAKKYSEGQEKYYTSLGRFPANLLVSDKALDTGEKQRGGITNYEASSIYGSKMDRIKRDMWIEDIGGRSRYFDLDAWFEARVKRLPVEVQKTFPFLQVPKASKKERNEGLNNTRTNFEKHRRLSKVITSDNPNLKGRKANPINQVTQDVKDFSNRHPTVKPLKLMMYLIELGCPEDGVVLDPFLGSGTTAVACKMLKRSCIGIEINPEYCEIAEKRLSEAKVYEDLREAFV